MTCGCKWGDIFNHDGRIYQHVVSSWGGENGHSRDITALEWSSDENMCVSGSSDRTAKIWEGRFVRGDGVIQDPVGVHRKAYETRWSYPV